MAKKSGNDKDLFHGDGNSSKASAMPTSVTNHAGKTDPSLKNAGKLLPTKKVVQKGWSK